VAGLIDTEGREFVEGRRRHVESGAVIIEIEPVERPLIGEKGQVIIEGEVAVPVVDVFVPRHPIIGEGQADQDGDAQQQRRREGIPAPVRARQCSNEGHPVCAGCSDAVR
jgi:hypothetical protein